MEHILTLFDGSKAPVSLSQPATKRQWEKLLYSLEHPFIYPVLEADYMAERERAIVFRSYSPKGSLLDAIYGNSDPQKPYLSKYQCKLKLTKFDELLGMPSSIKQQSLLSYMSVESVQTAGKQILEALLYLKKSRIPYPHLHCGNVIVQVFLFWSKYFEYDFFLLLV